MSLHTEGPFEGVGFTDRERDDLRQRRIMAFARAAGVRFPRLKADRDIFPAVLEAVRLRASGNQSEIPWADEAAQTILAYRPEKDRYGNITDRNRRGIEDLAAVLGEVSA